MAFISFNLEYLVDPIWDIGFESNSDQKEEKPAAGRRSRKIACEQAPGSVGFRAR